MGAELLYMKHLPFIIKEKLHGHRIYENFYIFTVRSYAVNAVLATAILSVCLSVRPSVTRRNCVIMNERRMMPFH